MLPTPPRPDQAKEALLPESEAQSEKRLDEREWDDEITEEENSDLDDTDHVAPDEPGPDEPEPDEPQDGDDDDLITIATFRTAPEAELVKTALDAEGIVCFIADAEMVTMDWLLGVAVGDVKVQVARRVAAQAREFLARSRQTRDDEAAGPTRCLACGAQFPDDANRCPTCGWSFEDEAH